MERLLSNKNFCVKIVAILRDLLGILFRQHLLNHRRHTDRNDINNSRRNWEIDILFLYIFLVVLVTEVVL